MESSKEYYLIVAITFQIRTLDDGLRTVTSSGSQCLMVNDEQQQRRITTQAATRHHSLRWLGIAIGISGDFTAKVMLATI